MIIDKDFPGLEDKGGWYYFAGSIETEENLIINIPLKAGEGITAGEGICQGFLPRGRVAACAR